MDIRNHHLALSYYYDDHGIWIACYEDRDALVRNEECGFKRNLGYTPSPEDVRQANIDHSREFVQRANQELEER